MNLRDFNARTELQPATGCLFYVGPLNKKGYGAVGKKLAHRVAWEFAYGPIPSGMCVCHSCDIHYPIRDRSYRRCVNPEHLWLGTYLENSLDRDKKKRTATVERCGHLWASGDRNGSRTHPECLPRGDNHPYRRNPFLVRKGDACPAAKLNDESVSEILSVAAQGGYRVDGLAKKYGVSKSAISAILSRKTWKHIPSATILDSIGRTGVNNGRAKLSEDDVRLIRGLATGGEQKTKIADRFGVTPQAVHAIITRRLWAHVR